MGLRTGDIELSEGELFIVPKGVEHKPSADGGVLDRPDRARRHAQHRQRRRRDARSPSSTGSSSRGEPLGPAPRQRSGRLLRRLELHRLRHLPPRGARRSSRRATATPSCARSRPEPTTAAGRSWRSSPVRRPRSARSRRRTPSEGVRAYPETIEENVSFCGFTAESSFGAWSYFIARPDGNVLVDSPRAAGPLLAALEERGGVATLFLTHRDDVADHAALARRFGCERVMHADDVTAATRDVEQPIPGRIRCASTRICS